MTHPYVRVVLGVDPGSTSGWARMLSSGSGPCRLDNFGLAKSGDVTSIQGVICGRQGFGVSRHLAIEEQWIPRPGKHGAPALVAKSHAQALAALGVAEVRGVWQGLAHASLYEVHVIHPSTWRSAVLGSSWASKPRDQVKKYALSVVAARWGVKLLRSHDHVAEAILIAEYLDTLLRTGRENDS